MKAQSTCAEGHRADVSRHWPKHSTVQDNGGRHPPDGLLRILTGSYILIMYAHTFSTDHTVHTRYRHIVSHFVHSLNRNVAEVTHGTFRALGSRRQAISLYTCMSHLKLPIQPCKPPKLTDSHPLVSKRQPGLHQLVSQNTVV